MFKIPDCMTTGFLYVCLRDCLCHVDCGNSWREASSVPRKCILIPQRLRRVRKL